MGDTQGFGAKGSVEEGRREVRSESRAGQAQPRAVGSPLPVGSGSPTALTSGVEDLPRGQVPAPPPGRALTNSSANAPFDISSGIQRAVGAIRAALPFVQRLLPLIEGNIGAAVSNMLAPQQHHALPPQPAALPVDLAPLEDGLAKLQAQQCELSDQIVEQNTTLKRVEDQLEAVREATDRNTLEQQELLEDLKVVGNKMNLFAMIVVGLLAISMLINIFLYMRIKSVFP
jgi:hypothetical protein